MITLKVYITDNMIININEDIGKETVDKLANSINQLKSAEKLFIYFASGGGDIEAIEPFIHIINNNIDIIEIVAYGEIKSSEFEIFFKCMCHRILLNNTLGMYHHSKVTVNINENGTPSTKFDHANKVWTKNLRDQTISFCKGIEMTDKEILEIKQGKDVYFQPKRMQELLKVSQQNINKA